MEELRITQFLDAWKAKKTFPWYFASITSRKIVRLKYFATL